jgi:hypothetical protein
MFPLLSHGHQSRLLWAYIQERKNFNNQFLKYRCIIISNYLFKIQRQEFIIFKKLWESHNFLSKFIFLSTSKLVSYLQCSYLLFNIFKQVVIVVLWTKQTGCINTHILIWKYKLCEMNEKLKENVKVAKIIFFVLQRKYSDLMMQ